MIYTEKEKTIPPNVAFEETIHEKNIDVANTLQQISDKTQYKITEPHKVYLLIKNFLASIKTPSPVNFHMKLSEEILKKKERSNPQCVQLLAEELRLVMHVLEEKMPHIPSITEFKKNTDLTHFDWIDAATSLPTNDQSLKEADRNCFDKKGVFKPLNVYIKTIELLGINGKKYAKMIRKTNLKADSTFWFILEEKRKEGPFYFSKAFLGLALIVFRDKVEERISFDKRFPVCTTLPTLKTISSLMRAKKNKSSNTNQIQLIDGSDVIGNIDIPLVPSHLHDKVFRGISKINTVTGHKALRYSVSLPFKQKLKGIEDFRVKEFEGGFSELGREIGIKNNRNLAELREILYALKHIDIPNIKNSRITEGRLIDVTHFKSSKTGREDGLILTVLPTLVGYGEIDCRGMLLIPMATLAPPLKNVVDAPRFFPSLYFLQMLLMEEFSNKSKEFSQYECIKITESDWERMLIKANIPISYRKRILDGWTVDGDDAPRVLKIVDKDHYSFGESYKKPSKFLLDQGRIRLKQSLRGKESAKKKKKTTPQKTNKKP